MTLPLLRRRLRWPAHPGNSRTAWFPDSSHQWRCGQKTLPTSHSAVPPYKVRIQVFKNHESRDSNADIAAGISLASYSNSTLYPQMPWSSTPILNSPSHSTEPSDFDAPSSAHWQPRAQPGPQAFEYNPYPSSAIASSRHSSAHESFSNFPHPQVGDPADWAHLPHQPVRSMSLASPNDLQKYHSPYHNDPRMLLQQNATTASNMHPTSLPGNTNHAPHGSDVISTRNVYGYDDHLQMGAPYHSIAPMQSPSMPHPASEAFGHGYYGVQSGLADVTEEEEMANMHHQTTTGRFRHNPG